MIKNRLRTVVAGNMVSSVDMVLVHTSFHMLSSVKSTRDQQCSTLTEFVVTHLPLIGCSVIKVYKQPMVGNTMESFTPGY